MTTTDTINTSKPLATSTTWRIDPDQSEARFAAATLWGGVPVSGQLGEVSGTLAWDGAAGRGQMTIATPTLSSGIALRDHHLRSRAFFHVAEHPELTFDAHEVIADCGHVRLRGELLVRGRRHPFECSATVKALDDSQIALETEAALDLDELGMSRGLLRMIPAGVKASIRVVLKQAAA
jgi:polyisoprenoid-binding protein YceI